MKKIEIVNELNNREYKAVLKEPKVSQWLEKHINKNTFGKPEREIEYKVELIDGDSIEVIKDEFDVNLVDRVLSERDETTGLLGELLDIEYTGIKYKRYYRTVKSDYVVTETDVTIEEEEKEAKRVLKKQRKEAALVTLSDISTLDLSKKADLEIAINSIVHYLEIETE